MDTARLGRGVRVLRQKRGWRQDDLAREAGVSQDVVSLLERGLLERVSVRSIERVVEALDASLVLAIRWRGGELDRLLDARHAALTGDVVTTLRGHGWESAIEVTYSRFGERGSIDILAWHAASRSLLVVEVKTELVSVEETLRRHDQKVRLAPTVARDRSNWSAATVSRLLVLPGDSTPRRQVARNAAVLVAALPQRGAAVRSWLGRPVGQMSGIWFVSPTTGSRRSERPITRNRVRNPPDTSSTGVRRS